MHYYPLILPYINKSKLVKFKKYSAKSTLLYSDEGLFQVKGGKLYQVHFIDDENSFKKKLGTHEFMCDDSKIEWSLCNKLPYEFERRDIINHCYEKGSLKLYLEEFEGNIVNLYFYVKDIQIYGIEDDIIEMLTCAK
jgi:hypothetical protein